MARARLDYGTLRRRPVVADGAFAVVGAVVAEVEIWTSELTDEPRVVGAAAALVVTLALAWRRRAPLASAVVPSLGTMASFSSVGIRFWSWVVLVVMVSSYSVAAHCDLRRASIGAALALAVGALATLQEDNESVGHFLGNFVFVGGLARGASVGRRRARCAAAGFRPSLSRTAPSRSSAKATSGRAPRSPRSGCGSRANCTTWSATRSGHRRPSGGRATHSGLSRIDARDPDHDRAGGPRGARRDAQAAEDDARRRRAGRARACAQPHPARQPCRAGPRPGCPSRRSRARRRAATGRRPLGLPDRAGGTDQRAQARGPGTGARHRQLRGPRLRLEIADDGAAAGDRRSPRPRPARHARTCGALGGCSSRAPRAAAMRSTRPAAVRGAGP